MLKRGFITSLGFIRSVILKSPQSEHRWKQRATFEAGTLTPNPTGFDSTGGVGGNLDVLSDAAIYGNYGFRVTVGGVGSEAYGILNEANNETTIYMEIYLDTNGIIMSTGEEFNLVLAVSPGTGGSAFVINLGKDAIGFFLRSFGKTDAGGNVIVGFERPVYPAKIGVEWIAATAPGENNGIMRLYINDEQKAEATTIDNDTHSITEIRSGTVAGLDAGTSGTVDFDNIAWRNSI